MNRRSIPIAMAALLLFFASAAEAHKPSDSYLALAPHAAKIDATWDIALRDLDDAVGLDDDGDGAITWGELRAHQEQLFAYALSRLRIRSKGADCKTAPLNLQVDTHSDGAYAVLRFTAECVAPIESLELSYSLLFDIDPSHRGLLRLSMPQGVQTAIFSPDHPAQVMDLSARTGLSQLAAFVREGILHIWTGFDHILFLLALLLPAVLRREGGRWVPVASARVALREILKVVTMFTLAHSITLTLATLGVVSLPSRWVESAIALSVLLAAINNLVPILRGRQWAFAFGFGLLHGFGFASVLVDLGLPRGSLARALFGFNAGVEIGQLAIVATFFALAYALRATRVYRRIALIGGSVAIAGLSSLWLVERAFDVRIL